MPVATMASAASRMILSVTWSVQMYQLFQPMCGVKASVSPQTILNFRSAWPQAFLARSVTVYSTATVRSEPVIWPVWNRPSVPRADYRRQTPSAADPWPEW